jgi:hypothetical protein
MTFTATAIGGTTSSILEKAAGDDQRVLSGWEFSTTGYDVSSSQPIYLSFAVGEGFSAEDFDLWHFDGSAWTPYSANDLTYDGKYASFTVTGLSGYAATAVPEPGTLLLLAVGLFGVFVFGRRRVR